MAGTIPAKRTVTVVHVGGGGAPSLPRPMARATFHFPPGKVPDHFKALSVGSKLEHAIHGKVTGVSHQDYGSHVDVELGENLLPSGSMAAQVKSMKPPKGIVAKGRTVADLTPSMGGGAKRPTHSPTPRFGKA